MRTRFLNPVLSLAALTFLLVACTEKAPEPAAAPPPTVDVAATTAEIQAMEDAYATAVVERNVDGILPYYADDVVSYTSFKEPASGKAALRQRLEEQMTRDTLGMKPTFKVLDVFAGGDHVTEVGSWSEADSAGVVKDHGTYISVFRKTDDKWLCIRDMSVSAMPKDTAATVAVVQ